MLPPLHLVSDPLAWTVFLLKQSARIKLLTPSIPRMPNRLYCGRWRGALLHTGTGSSGTQSRIYYASNKHGGESQESMKTAKDFPSSFKNHLIRLAISILHNYFRRTYSFQCFAICGANPNPSQVCKTVIF